MRNATIAVIAVATLFAGVVASVLWVGAARDPEAESDASEGAAVLERARAHAAQPGMVAERGADAKAALERVRRELRGDALRDALIDQLVALAETDPALATELAATLSDEEGRASALHECLPLWLASAPEAARSWLLSNVRSLPAETAQALARDAASSDPALGLSVARQIYVGHRAPAMREVFSAWTASDPKAASQAVGQLSKEDGYFGALEEIGRLWSESDAPSAYAWASALRGADARRSALTPLIDRWAQTDPAAAARAVEALPYETWRARLIDDVATRWTANDPKAALAWVQGLQDPSEREAGATTVLTELLPTQPELAAQWAVKLGGDARSPLVEKVMTAWLARDPSAAEGWLRNNPAARPRH